MHDINEFINRVQNNYVIIAIAAILFFLVKAITAYLTFRHYEKRLKRIEEKLDKLLRKKSH